MLERVTTIAGKLTFVIARSLHLGSGGTWPGEVALFLQRNILKSYWSHVKKGVIIVAGTNGKTTTAKMIATMLSPKKIITNISGANLLNGLVSAFIQKSGWFGGISGDWAVFEVDERTLALLLAQFTKRIEHLQIILVCLNLFRDQLDRYGEVDAIAILWQKALEKFPFPVTLILNADDPQVAYLGQNSQNKNITSFYFGLSEPREFLVSEDHASDFSYCPKCYHKLSYQGFYFSHLGVWKCSHCGNSRPKLDISDGPHILPGLYNRYNTLAAVQVGKILGLSDNYIASKLRNFQPAFGRQEELEVGGNKIKILLSKNPAGFNASLRTVLEAKPKVLVLVLNDRIPDGKDVSWIWDVDFEMISPKVALVVSGDRVYDFAVRMKYAINTDLSHHRLYIEPELKKAIDKGLELTPEKSTLFILPTYTAMLETRQILKGRKIL